MKNKGFKRAKKEDLNSIFEDDNKLDISMITIILSIAAIVLSIVSICF